MSILKLDVNKKASKYFILFLLWVFATFFNLFKAFHIDDTAYLLMAKVIQEQPLKPLSGMISWGADYQAVFDTNQPLLFPYILAAWTYLFGFSELSAHILIMFFTLWCISAIYRLGIVLIPSNALFVTCLISLSPVFIISQNVMVDIPLFAFILEFFLCLLKSKNNAFKDLFLSGLLSGFFLSGALLTKYSAIALLPVYLLLSILRKDIKVLLYSFIPLIALGLWSLFNLYDYGAVHILGRNLPKTDFVNYLNRGIYFIATLGAITPFAILFIYKFNLNIRSRLLRLSFLTIKSALSLIFLLPWILIVIFFFKGNDFEFYNEILKPTFIIIGGSLILIFLFYSLRALLKRNYLAEELLLIYWFFSLMLFPVLFAPFMASRHVLLTLPPLLFFLFRALSKRHIETPRSLKYFLILLSIFVSTFINLSDYEISDLYRKQARLIAEKYKSPERRIYFDKNWGWQWYAIHNGMLQYSKKSFSPSPNKGDLLVVPENVCCKLAVSKDLSLIEIERIKIERTNQFFSVDTIGLYSAKFFPWKFRGHEVEEFVVYEVYKSETI